MLYSKDRWYCIVKYIILITHLPKSTHVIVDYTGSLPDCFEGPIRRVLYTHIMTFLILASMWQGDVSAGKEKMPYSSVIS